MAYHITENFYHELRNEYSGICRSCHTVKYGDVEPDAENYECENCGKHRVFGIEQLIIYGLVDIDENAEKPFVTLKKKDTKEIIKQDLKF